MKKLISILTAVLFAFALTMSFSSCGGDNGDTGSKTIDDKSGNNEESKKNDDDNQKSDKIRKFNADNIKDECDWEEYALYGLTKLNKLRTNSEASDANEMNSQSKEIARSLLREFYNAHKFQSNNEEIDWGGKSKCKIFKEYQKAWQTFLRERFYKDMLDEIEDELESVEEEFEEDLHSEESTEETSSGFDKDVWGKIIEGCVDEDESMIKYCTCLMEQISYDHTIESYLSMSSEEVDMLNGDYSIDCSQFIPE